MSFQLYTTNQKTHKHMHTVSHYPGNMD